MGWSLAARAISMSEGTAAILLLGRA